MTGSIQNHSMHASMLSSVAVVVVVVVAVVVASFCLLAKVANQLITQGESGVAGILGLRQRRA